MNDRIPWRSPVTPNGDLSLQHLSVFSGNLLKMNEAQLS